MVETDRLKIMPLSYKQLIKYLNANNILEHELGLASSERFVSAEVKNMIQNFALPRIRKANADNYLFCTFWIVIDKLNNSIVAELGFKGAPNDKGEIEIGYGTMPDQQGKGYMTEAVSAMIKWASQRKDVRYVLAETNKNNTASIRIVQKNHFEQYDKKGEMLWWRKKLNHD